MTQDEVEILYIEDNAADAELALVALRRTRLANPIRIVRDGAEALDSSSVGVRMRIENFSPPFHCLLCRR